MSARPWDEINRPSGPGEYSTRLVAPDYPYQLFWALDHLGRQMMVMNLLPTTELVSQLVAPEGFSLSISPGAGAVPKRIILRLLKGDAHELFEKVCIDLVAVVRMQNSEDRAARVLLERVGRWQAFLKQSASLYLSEEEQRGLFGELLFLEQFALPLFPPRSAIEYWTAPEAPKDFTLSDRQVEIKTRMTGGRNRVRISSVEQLDSTGLQLFLGVYALSRAAEDEPGAVSLFGLADRIEAALHLADPVAADLFLSRLFDANYHRDEYYGRMHYVPEPIDIYAVAGAFPKIVSSVLADGVLDVAYSIDLGKCKSFKVSSVTFTEQLGLSHG